MSEKSSANCPECNLVLRFSASKSGTVALKCPGCGMLFETEVQLPGTPTTQPAPQATTRSASAEKKVVQAKVVQAKVVSGPAAQPVQPQSAADDEIFEGELVEEELLEGELIEETAPVAESEPQAPMRPKLNKPPGKKKTERDKSSSSKSTTSTSSGNKKWLMPAGIGAVAAVLGGIALFASGLFSSGTDSQSLAITSAERLNGVVAEYVQTLKTVTDGESRAPAAQKLVDLESELAGIAFDALSCGEVEGEAQAEAVRSLLTEGSPLRADASSESRRINSNYPLDDELYVVDQRLKSMVHAIEQHLNYSLNAPTIADSPVQRTCASTIVIKRRIVATIAKLNDGANPTSTVEQLYRMSDELNQLAEEHSKTGRRISLMAHEYESANRAADAMRQWLVEYVEETLKPEPELLYTLEEVEATARRVELAFRAGVSKLGTTTKQRVDARLFAINIVPKAKDSPVIASAPPPSSIASVTPSAQPRLKPDARPSSSSSETASVTPPGSNATIASSTLAPAKNDTANSFGAAAVGDGRPSLASSSPADDGEYRPSLQPAALYMGQHSIQIKVIGAAKEDLEADFRSLVSMIGAPASDIAGSGNRVTMSFPYSGSMYKIAKMVGFGEVQCCDIQSRTLFVAAE